MHPRSQRVLAAFLAAALGTGVAWAGGKPDWVTGTSSKYPSELYVTGVGEADTRAEAENDARRRIAQFFETKVSGVIKEAAEELTTQTGKKTSQQYQEQFQTQSTLETNKVLEGVSVREAWNDPDSARWYVLAVLDRDEVARNLKGRIGELDREIEENLKIAESGGRMDQSKAYRGILETLQKRTVLNGDLRVVSSDGKGVPAKVSAVDVQHKLDALLSGVKIGVFLAGTKVEPVRDAVMKTLTGAGYGILDGVEKTSEEAEVALVGRVDTKPQDGAGDGWDWATSELSADVIDMGTGKVLGNVSERVREGDRGREKSLGKASRKLAEKVTGTVLAQVNGALERGSGARGDRSKGTEALLTRIKQFAAGAPASAPSAAPAAPPAAAAPVVAPAVASSAPSEGGAAGLPLPGRDWQEFQVDVGQKVTFVLPPGRRVRLTFMARGLMGGHNLKALQLDPDGARVDDAGLWAEEGANPPKHTQNWNNGSSTANTLVYTSDGPVRFKVRSENPLGGE